MKTFTLRYPESFGERLSSAAAEEQVSVNTGSLRRSMNVSNRLKTVLAIVLIFIR
jgi:predicted HicB family RNase H-like nuclease